MRHFFTGGWRTGLVSDDSRALARSRVVTANIHEHSRAGLPGAVRARMSRAGLPGAVRARMSRAGLPGAVRARMSRAGSPGDCRARMSTGEPPMKPLPPPGTFAEGQRYVYGLL